MIGRMTVKISRPIWCTFSTAEPFLRCIFQSRQNILLYLPVPSQDLIRRATVPAQVNEMVSLGYVKPAFVTWYALSPGGTSNVGLPMGNVSECIFDGPGVFGFRAGYQSIPLVDCKVGNEMIKKFKLLNRTFDNFLTVVTHGRETSYTCAAQRWRSVGLERGRHARTTAGIGRGAAAKRKRRRLHAIVRRQEDPLPSGEWCDNATPLLSKSPIALVAG
jgi:hypothetical protein